MASLVRQSFRILFGRFSISILGLLFTVYYARELSKEKFAGIVLYETAAAFFMVITDLGLSAMIIKDAPPLLRDKRDREAIDELIVPGTMLRIVSALFFIMLYAITASFFDQFIATEFTGLPAYSIILFASLGIFFEGLGTITEPIYSVKQRFGMNSFFGAAQALAEQIFAFICFINFGLAYYFVGVFAAQLLLFVLRLVYIWDVVRFFNLRTWTWQKSKAMLASYFPFYLRRFFRMGFLQGEQILVAALLPLSQLANFNVAKRTAKFMKPYIEAFMNPFMIKLSKTRDLELSRSYQKTFLLFTLPLPIVMCVLSPWIMQIFGGKYSGNWTILAIFYFSWTFYALSSMQLSIVTIFGKNKESLYADGLAGIIGFIATFILIMLFGEAGLAWGQVVSFLTLYIAGLVMSRKYYQVHVDRNGKAAELQPKINDISAVKESL